MVLMLLSVQVLAIDNDSAGDLDDADNISHNSEQGTLQQQSKRFLDIQKQLPWPAELDADIQFWINVYTKVDTGSGYLHDAKHLNIVYGKIKFNPDISRKARNKLVKKHRKRISRALNHLATGDRQNLNAEETRILKLFPEDVTKKELKAAIERIRFQLGQSDKFREGIARSGRWMPHISAMMQKHEVPDLLRLLPHVESSFIPYARSHVGAAGMWQFTRSTGRRFMKVNHVLDERLDPYIAAEAAAKLLRHNYNKVGSWPLAITAYNHGLRSATRAADKFGKDNLVQILREYDGARFGFASRNFYLSFVAAAHVHINYQTYFGKLQIEEYQNPDIFRLPNYLSTQAFRDTKIDVESLRKLNPALSKSVWDGDKYAPKNYALRLPKGTINTIVGIDKQHWYTRQTPDLFHTVRRGESLSQIAERHRIRLSALKKANNIRNAHRIRIGQRLVLPGRIAKNNKSNRVIQRQAVDGVYTVQTGDTVSTIAESFRLNTQDLMAWNQIKNVRQLQPGQILQLTNQKNTVAALSEDTAIIEQKTQNVVPASPEPVDVAVAIEPAKKENKLALSKQEVTAVSLGVAEETSALETAEPKVANVNTTETADDIYDYTVRDDNTIEILPQETLGHYADWLNVYARDLRRINKLHSKKPVIVGNRLKLTFTNASAQEFEEKRQTYHLALQEDFYQRYKVQGETKYQIKNGDSLWLLTQRDYRVPIWLLQKYNPDIEIEKIRPGATVIFPLVVKR